MSFGGHVNDMVNRIKQNTALKNARKGKFKGGNDYSNVKYAKTEYDFPKVSKTKLDDIKAKIQEKAKLEQNSNILKLVFLILILVVLFLIFNFF